MATTVTYGNNPYEQNPNPYVSTVPAWKKYADNNGASLLGMDVHYIDCREGTAKCIAAKIIKVNSGWETYAQTINCNVKVKFPNGTTSTLTLDLSGRTGPTCPNWHFSNHDKSLVPVLNPVPVYPPGTIIEDNRGTYNPAAPPSPNYTGSYVIQDSSINNGQCTYFAWDNGVQTANILLTDCNQDTVPLNEQYLGQDSGNVTTPVNVPSSSNDSLLGQTEGFGSGVAFFGMGVQWFPSGALAARGVEGVFASNTVSNLRGTNCGAYFSSTSEYYFEQVRLTVQSGTYLSLGVITQCSGVKYFAATKTVGGSQTLISTKPYVGGTHIFTIEQSLALGYTLIHDDFVASPTHRENMLGDWDYAAIGSYKAADGRTFFTQLFSKKGSCPTQDTLTVPVNNPIFEWPNSTYSAAAENQNFKKLNAYRVANGKPTLALNPYLLSKARSRSKDMVIRNFFGHRIPDAPPYPTSNAHWATPQDPPGTHSVFDEIDSDIQANRTTFCYDIAGENVGWREDQGVYNDWTFTIDGNIMGRGFLNDGRGGQATLAGLESHTARNIVIPKLTITGLKYLFDDDVWKSWSGQVAQVVSTPGEESHLPVMCGQFASDTSYVVAQNTSCS